MYVLNVYCMNYVCWFMQSAAWFLILIVDCCMGIVGFQGWDHRATSNDERCNLLPFYLVHKGPGLGLIKGCTQGSSLLM